MLYDHKKSSNTPICLFIHIHENEFWKTSTKSHAYFFFFLLLQMENEFNMTVKDLVKNLRQALLKFMWHMRAGTDVNSCELVQYSNTYSSENVGVYSLSPDLQEETT